MEPGLHVGRGGLEGHVFDVDRHQSMADMGVEQVTVKIGRGERIRTSDPLVPNQVLYQAEPLPDVLIMCGPAIDLGIALQVNASSTGSWWTLSVSASVPANSTSV